MPLTPMERLQLRDRLQELWREQVETLSTAAVRAHTSSTASASESVAQQLSVARVKLTELEAAMHRMDARRFGLCEVCAGTISFDELLVSPHARRCASCVAGADGLPRHVPSCGSLGMPS